MNDTSEFEVVRYIDEDGVERNHPYLRGRMHKCNVPNCPAREPNDDD